ncbi:Disease resistance protein RGA2 [Linum perenne]
MPAFPNLELELELKDTSAEPLAQTMKPPSSSIAKPLSRLVELSFEEASDLESIPEDGFSSLVSLEVIRISKHHGLELPNWLCSAMTVKEINLRKCRDLEYLPEGVRNLGSLRVMVIVSCPRLGSLPRAMQELASLQKLKIERCPQLAERCREGLGEDWPNISQVTEIQLD